MRLYRGQSSSLISSIVARGFLVISSQLSFSLFLVIWFLRLLPQVLGHGTFILLFACIECLFSWMVLGIGIVSSLPVRVILVLSIRGRYVQSGIREPLKCSCQYYPLGLFDWVLSCLRQRLCQTAMGTVRPYYSHSGD